MWGLCDQDRRQYEVRCGQQAALPVIRNVSIAAVSTRVVESPRGMCHTAVWCRRKRDAACFRSARTRGVATRFPAHPHRHAPIGSRSFGLGEHGMRSLLPTTCPSMTASKKARHRTGTCARAPQLAPRANALLLALLCCTVLPVQETRSSAPPDLPRSHSAFGALTGLAVSPGPGLWCTRPWRVLRVLRVLRQRLGCQIACVCALRRSPRSHHMRCSSRTLVQRTSPPNVTISPPLLDFKRRHMCLPAVEEFVVTNTAASGELVIYSCSSDSSAFQPSFFHEQVVRLAIPAPSPEPHPSVARDSPRIRWQHLSPLRYLTLFPSPSCGRADTVTRRVHYLESALPGAGRGRRAGLVGARDQCRRIYCQGMSLAPRCIPCDYPLRIVRIVSRVRCRSRLGGDVMRV